MLAVNPSVDHNGGMTRTDPPLRIRLSEDLKKQVQDLAAQNHRSMNAEIVARLERTIREDEQKKLGGLRFPASIKKKSTLPSVEMEVRILDLEERIKILEGK